MKKLISLVLTLIVVLSVLPAGASALSWSEFERIEINPDKTEAAPYVGYTYNGKEVNLSQKDLDTLEAQYKAYLIRQEEKMLSANHSAISHDYDHYGWNAKYHWMECVCGCRVNMERHVDPKNAPTDFCTCGYHFSDNAELVTLWLDGCEGLKNFQKDVYEYETKAYTYKDVPKIKRIATRTFDSQATVEIPEDLTLKDGENKIEIKVTAENQKVTKVYTVIVHKEPKK